MRILKYASAYCAGWVLYYLLVAFLQWDLFYLSEMGTWDIIERLCYIMMGIPMAAFAVLPVVEGV